MNARTKLNSGYVNGSVVFAALTGWLTESVLIFVLTAIGLIAGAFHSGDIRLGASISTRKSRHRR